MLCFSREDGQHANTTKVGLFHCYGIRGHGTNVLERGLVIRVLLCPVVHARVTQVLLFSVTCGLKGKW